MDRIQSQNPAYPHYTAPPSSSFSSSSSHKPVPGYHPQVNNDLKTVHQPEPQTTKPSDSVPKQEQPEVDSWEDIGDEPATASAPKPHTQTEAPQKTQPKASDSSLTKKKDHSESRAQSAKKSNGKQESTASAVEKSSKQAKVVPKKALEDKENVNIVFIGHVGKWALIGQLARGLIMFSKGLSQFTFVISAHRCWKVNYWRTYHVREGWGFVLLDTPTFILLFVVGI